MVEDHRVAFKKLDLTPQRFQGLADVFFHAADGNTQAGGDILVGQVFIPAQKKHFFTFFGQPVKDHVDLRFQVFRFQRVGKIDFAIFAKKKPLPVFVSVRCRTKFIYDLEFQCLKQISPERAGEFDGGSAAIEVNKDVLNDILGFFPGIQPLTSNVEQGGPMSFIQLFKCLFVALFN
jgi:hypothetical protein